MEGQRHSARQAIWFVCLFLVLIIPARAEQDEPSGETPESKSTSAEESAPAEENATASDHEASASDARPISEPVVTESALVKAAESNRSKQKPRIVITDDDVRKSRGKLIEVGGTLATNQPGREDEPPVTSESSAPQEPSALSPERKAEVQKRYEEQIKTKTQAIKELEKEIRGLEEDFYVEQDPAMRDRIDQRFVDAQSELEEARKSLEETRKSYDELRRRDS